MIPMLRVFSRVNLRGIAFDWSGLAWLDVVRAKKWAPRAHALLLGGLLRGYLIEISI
jgi:hypothetical protein